MNILKDKVCIITGGAQGMGEFHARRFVEEGAKLVITDLNEEKGNEVAKDIGENCIFIKQDVSSEDDWDKVITETKEKFGKIDVLVNNAGVGVFKDILDITKDDMDFIYKVNQLGLFLGVKKVGEVMKEQGSGSIINISSVDGIVSAPTATAYAASKHAVEGITKSAAIDLGQFNIRVNTVCPGIIKTPMTSQDDVEAYLEELEKTIPLRRRGEPEESTGPVLFLASDDSTYVTGTHIIIDGGMTCQL